MSDPTSFADCYRHRGAPMVSGVGCRVTDAEGRTFLDLGSGVAVNALGHAHPRLVTAVADQAKLLMHVSNLYAAPSVVECAQRVTEACGLERVFFCNSGAEANEAAIKLARRWFQVVRGEPRFRIVAAHRSFHGRTLAAVSVTGNPSYHEGFEPLLPGVDFVPFGDEDALSAAVGDETAAILLEPVQGEGGVILPPEGYLDAARRIADEAGCLLIADEVQTGVGRTGTFLACEPEGVEPDVVTLAKGIAGGLPLGAMVHRGELAEALPPGSHMSTFGGNPVACAAANVVLSTVGAPGFLEHVRARGDQAVATLSDALLGLEHVREVRGRGLLVGVELDRPAAPWMARLHELGVLVTVAGGNVLRLSPPLLISTDDLGEGLRVVAEALSVVAR